MNPPNMEETARQIVVTNPDPTAAVKEALELAIKNLDEKIDRRFQGIDQATVLAREEQKDKLSALQSTLTNAATALASANKDLVGQLAQANQIALTAALQTQKESASKSELATADIIRQLQTSFETAIKVVNEKIDRLTSRLDTGEGRVVGVADYRTYIIAAIGAALAIAAFFGLGLHR
jgi:hypothetical protein